MLDARDGVTEQDTKIAGLIHEEGKAVVVVVNKWDAVEKDTGTFEKYQKQVLSDLKFMTYAPVLFISALSGQRVQTVLAKVREVYENACRRVTTGILNDALSDATNDLPHLRVGGVSRFITVRRLRSSRPLLHYL